MDYPDPKRSAATGLPLPDDPLVEILSRVPVKALHRSKCVSKGWRDLIADPLHSRKLPQTLQGFFLAEGFINPFGGSKPPVDPSFRFLKKLPGIGKIWLRGSCNGLLLFRHEHEHDPSCTISYIVYNPSTEQWAAVPSEHTPADEHNRVVCTCLVFDPAVSSHFQLVTFCAEENWNLATVHAYSSKTGVWNHSQIDWAEEVMRPDRWGGWHGWDPYISGRVGAVAFCNGRLYSMLNDYHIAEVDGEGKIRGIIRGAPLVCRQSSGYHSIFIGQSQGRLHCITEERCARDILSELSSHVYTRGYDNGCGLLSIWVLDDYHTQKWVLKHSVSHMHLFGSRSYKASLDYDVVGIHPDSNFLFISLYLKQQLISYGLDSKEVRALATFEQDSVWFTLTPYVPCFLDFLSVAEHDDKLKVCGKPSAKDVAGAADHSGQ